MFYIGIALFIMWVFEFVLAATYEADLVEEDTYLKLNKQNDFLIDSF